MRQRTTTGELTQRQLQVGEQVRRSLSEVMQRVDFHGEPLGMLSISEVRMSPDLKHANVFIMALAGGDVGELVIKLNQLAPHLQSMLGKMVRLKFTPKLRFLADTTLDHAWRIEELLRR